MAKIPNPADFQRNIPSPSRSIATIDTSQVSAGNRAIANMFGQLAEKEARSQFAKAQADLTISLQSAHEKYKNDPEWNTINERYAEETQKRISQIADSIGIPAMREQFLVENSPRINEAKERVAGVAWTKQKDFEIGDTANKAESLMNAGIQNGDLAESAYNFDMLVDSNVERGFMTADDAELAKQKFRNDLAVRHIKALAPEQREYALKHNKDVKANLPPDTYNTLLRQAEEDTNLGEAQKYAYEQVHVKNQFRENAIADAFTKYGNNPKRLKAVQEQLEYEYTKRDRATAEVQTELGNKWWDMITQADDPMASWEALKQTEDYQHMNADLQQSLWTAAKNAVKAVKVPFNGVANDEMQRLLTLAENGMKTEMMLPDTNPQSPTFGQLLPTKVDAGIALRNFYLNNRHNMSDSQRDKWGKVSLEGTMPPEVKNGLTDIQVLKSAMSAAGIKNDELKDQWLGEIGEWRNKWIQEKGKEPDDQDRQNWIDNKFMKQVVYDPSGWGQGTFAELTDAQRKKTVEEMKVKNIDAWNRAVQYYSDQGIMPNLQQVMYRWTRFAGERIE